MWTKPICTALLASAVAFTPAERVEAGSGEALAMGVLFGALAANHGVRKRPVYRHYNSAQYSQNRQVQTALNYFGYGAGRVDGVLGRQSRAAVSRFQAQMGFVPDSYIDGFEKDFLLSSYQRALTSSHVPPYNQIRATQGPSGLLRAFRNEQQGRPVQAGMMPVAPYGQAQLQALAQPFPMPTPVPAPIPVPRPAPVAVSAPVPVPAPVAQTTEVPPSRNDMSALPVFGALQEAKSISRHCDQISVKTVSQAGSQVPGRIGDATLVLNEQFCQSRLQAIADAQRQITALGLESFQAVENQCSGLASVMTDHVASLAQNSVKDAKRAVATMLASEGRPVDQLAMGARLCLGVAYRKDDGDMALGAALILTATGTAGYGELVAHHLREGFGDQSAHPARAKAWMDATLAALDANPDKAAPGQSEQRIAQLNAANQVKNAEQTAALPAFGILD